MVGESLFACAAMPFLIAAWSYPAPAMGKTSNSPKFHTWCRIYLNKPNCSYSNEKSICIKEILIFMVGESLFACAAMPFLIAAWFYSRLRNIHIYLFII